MISASKRTKWFQWLTMTCLLIGAPGGAVTAAAQQPAEAQPNDYGDLATWLCRPGRQDACAVDLSTTVVLANGQTSRETWAADPNAPIDCFYVYPTVSNDPGGNSDMVAGPEELGVIHQQFARFASQCRPFAPLYRQFTLTALRAMLGGNTSIPADRVLGYNDVKDAWNYYLEHDNGGRGVVLIGHSQGSSVLTQLIRNEIDGKPAQQRVISALLLGTNVAVPQGADRGGSFQHIPVCRSAGQIGCVVTYVTFRSTMPPPANSRFGRSPGAGKEVACTNPAALGGGEGVLHSYLASAGRSNGSAVEPAPWVAGGPAIDTPFVSVPGLLTAKCTSSGDFSYLEVTVHGDAADPRADDISGDVVANGTLLADWGLHLIDVNAAMGNLVEIVAEQAKSYLSGSDLKGSGLRGSDL